MIARLRRSPRHLGALAAALLATAVLSACGGGTDEAGPTAAPSSPGSIETEAPSAERQRDPKSPEAPAGKKPKPSQTRQATPDPQAKPTPQGSPAPAESAVPGCPAGLSDQACREAARATSAEEKSPPPAGKERCPDSLSQAECQALAAGTKPAAPASETKSQSQPVECPPALTATQCAELEARYAEATK